MYQQAPKVGVCVYTRVYLQVRIDEEQRDCIKDGMKIICITNVIKQALQQSHVLNHKELNKLVSCYWHQEKARRRRTITYCFNVIESSSQVKTFAFFGFLINYHPLDILCERAEECLLALFICYLRMVHKCEVALEDYSTLAKI